MQDHAEVADRLDEIASLQTFLGLPKFKVQAYERAAEVVRTVGAELAPLVEQDRLRELAGIGSALSAQIRELWNTGGSALLERLRSETPPGAAELVRVPSLTPRRILALSEGLGVSSLADLREACLAGRVRGLPGFGAKTEQRLLEAGEAWLARNASEPPAPLLLSRALELAEELQGVLARHGIDSSIAGALRRGEETVREVELLVATSASAAMTALSELRRVLRTEPERGVAHLSDRITVRVHPAADRAWGNALFVASGEAAHVAAVEQRAAERGTKLSEQSFADEQALYARVELPWVPPELRRGDVPLASLEADGATKLLELSELRGLVHCHTTFSDGKHSVLEMARAAEALGMQYLTITDHSPAAQYARGVSADDLKRQWDEIAAAQEQVNVRLLRGVESDILREGELDYPDSLLEELDVIIASIHSRHRLGREDMTKRIQRALGLPLFKIWGHGLGRILNHREPIDCDVPAILDTLAQSRGAIELNADPHRLDLPPAWIPAARARGIPFVVSVDAHSTQGFGVLRYGVTMARRGGLRAADVLNTLDAAAFAQRVRPVGG